jgi:hypothetical protein
MPVSGIDPAAGGLKIKYTATKLQPTKSGEGKFTHTLSIICKFKKNYSVRIR